MLETHRGTIELYLLSEFHPLPGKSDEFDARHYRYAGQTWPLHEFDGIHQMYRHVKLSPFLPRPLGSGDAILVHYHTLNLVTTLIVADRGAPLLHNGEPHKVYQRDPDEPVLIQLPRSLRFDCVEVEIE
jgi:hypothetical protein